MTLKRDLTSIALFCSVYGLLSLLVDNSYYQLIMTIVPIWAVMGLSWNLFSGYSGLISFGHAAFFGLGAYFVALSLSLWHISPWLSIPIAALLSGLAGLIIGLPTFRLRGHYFALAMLAYPLALLYVFEWLGFQEVALPMERETPELYMQFSNQQVTILIALALLAISLLVTALLSHSRFGMSLLAIKQNEEAAEASGINTLKWKVIAIVISAALAGAAGGLYAVVLLVVTPLAVFGMLVSAQALVIAMFGGVGTLWGPVIGAFVLVPLSELLHAKYAADFPGIQGVIYGCAVILVIIFAPEGVLWKVREWLKPNSSQLLGSTSLPKDITVDTNILKVNSAQKKSLPILEAKQLNKSFGGLHATQNLSFTVMPGELLGIIGPNGAGKTTLFNLLNGFITADTGDIYYQQDSIQNKRPNTICKLGIARTFQVAKPFSRLSIFDNVVIGAYGNTNNDIDAGQQASAALSLVGLLTSAKKSASILNNKELRLMELARALASKPKLILVDEILAGLDNDAMKAVVEVLKQVSELGITIVIIEHSMQSMVQLVDRFVVLDHGALLATGKPEEIVKNKQVIEAYLGKKWLDNAQAE